MSGTVDNSNAHITNELLDTTGQPGFITGSTHVNYSNDGTDPNYHVSEQNSLVFDNYYGLNGTQDRTLTSNINHGTLITKSDMTDFGTPLPDMTNTHVNLNTGLVNQVSHTPDGVIHDQWVIPV